jgi:hypothetical protein
MIATTLSPQVSFEINVHINSPSKSYATHQVKVIRRIHILLGNVQITCQATHILFQDEELRVCSGATIVCTTKEVSSARLQARLNAIPRLRIHIALLSSSFALMRVMFRADKVPLMLW